MIRGLESAAAGMRVRQDQQDVIANNLANVNTPGFKRTAVSFKSFSTELDQAVKPQPDTPATIMPEITAKPDTPGTIIPEITAKEDERTGHLTQTGVATDVALDGPGFFAVQGSQGQVLTRTGSFHVDQSGNLVTAQGFPVLGEKGPIQVNGADITIDSDGSVYSGGKLADRLSIQPDPANPSTTPTRIASGCLEGSNVNTVEEMVTMITALRAYEANQKSIQSLDQTLDKVINGMNKT